VSKREKRNAYMREYRAVHKAKIKAARDSRRDMIHAIKSVPCAMCGGTFPPYCMDFHHRNPNEKAFGIGQQAGVVGLDRLLEEIEKCDILCANCHRIAEHG
jgi:hypothetical protein